MARGNELRLMVRRHELRLMVRRHELRPDAGRGRRLAVGRSRAERIGGGWRAARVSIRAPWATIENSKYGRARGVCPTALTPSTQGCRAEFRTAWVTSWCARRNPFISTSPRVAGSIRTHN